MLLVEYQFAKLLTIARINVPTPPRIGSRSGLDSFFGFSTCFKRVSRSSCKRRRSSCVSAARLGGDSDIGSCCLTASFKSSFNVMQAYRLTRIRRQLVVYFLPSRGKTGEKGDKMRNPSFEPKAPKLLNSDHFKLVLAG